MKLVFSIMTSKTFPHGHPETLESSPSSQSPNGSMKSRAKNMARAA